jgi:hypothetical protein
MSRPLVHLHPIENVPRAGIFFCLFELNDPFVDSMHRGYDRKEFATEHTEYEKEIHRRTTIRPA